MNFVVAALVSTIVLLIGYDKDTALIMGALTLIYLNLSEK